METIFDRATRRVQMYRSRAPQPRYKNVVVSKGDGASPAAIVKADLVIDKRGGVGVVLKDRYGQGSRRVTPEDPCPCQNGRRFGACHGR